jgi:FkbM family methyltransferase
MTSPTDAPAASTCRICQALRRALSFPSLLFAKAFHVVFARPSMQKHNDRLLDMTLRARGYNNCCDPVRTGEAIFIRLLAAAEPKLCLDIGANKGAYAAMLLENTGADVVSFEPLPKAFAALQTLKARYPERFEAINAGVGAKAEKLRLHYGEEDSELASFSAEVNQIDYVGSENVNAMDVDVIPLDAYCATHLTGRYAEIDLLKIDTEGFEREVLLGARHTIATLRPKFVQIEYNWHQLFRGESLFSLAELLPGYKTYQLLPYGDGLARRDPKTPEANVFQYSNFVFVRDDVSLRALRRRMKRR